MGCSWCRQRLVHFGRESASISDSARTGEGSVSPSSDWKGIQPSTVANVMPDPAILEAETILAQHPDHVDALTYLARRAKTDRDWGRATAYFKRLQQQFPDDRQVCHDLAEIALLKGDSNTAVSLLATVLGRDDHDATAHYNIAVGLFRLGAHTDQVVTHLMACESLDPDAEVAKSARILLVSLGIDI